MVWNILALHSRSWWVLTRGQFLQLCGSGLAVLNDRAGFSYHKKNLYPLSMIILILWLQSRHLRYDWNLSCSADKHSMSKDIEKYLRFITPKILFPLLTFVCCCISQDGWFMPASVSVFICPAHNENPQCWDRHSLWSAMQTFQVI